jgi:hypothetical protein
VGRDLDAALSTASREVLEPPLRAVESLNERIREYDQKMEQIVRNKSPKRCIPKWPCLNK